MRKFVVRAFLCAMFVLFTGKASVAITQTADDYNDYPLTNGAILPNILILMDNSGSMGWQAYLPNYSVQSWSGIFSSNLTCNSGGPAMYTYNTSTYQFELSPTGGWNGSFLNWATMQETDVAKKVLVGGKTYPVATITAGVAAYPGRPGTGVDILIGNPTATNDGGSKSFPISATVPAGTVPTSPINYTQYSTTIQIKEIYVDNSPPAPLVGPLEYFQINYKNSSGSWVTDSTKYYIKVKKEKTNPCDSADFVGNDVGGVIQKISSNARIGLEFFNTSDSHFGKIIEPIVGPGYSQTFVANEEIYIPTTNTPLGEALYTALGYFSQNQLTAYNLTSFSGGSGMRYHSTDFAITKGAVGDPYFYASTNQMAPCAKSFVIVITDGMTNNDNYIPASVRGFDSSKGWNDTYPYWTGGGTPSMWYMPDVALIAHTQDIRPDLTGSQTLTIYTVYVFASDLSGIPLLETTAQAGGFTDSNANNIPDLLSEYTSFGRTYSGATYNPVPDTFFMATDGNLLAGELMSAVQSLLKRAASATAVSVLSTSANGAGNVYQAFFVPSKSISVATGTSLTTSTVTFTNTGTSTATSTSHTTSTATSRATSTVTSTTTSTSSATGTNSTYTTGTSTGTSSTTRTTTTTTTSTSTLTGSNDSGFTCPGGDTCSSSQIGGSGSNKIFQNIDKHPTTNTSTGTPFTTSTSHTTSTNSSYTTIYTTSTGTSRGTSTVTSYTTSTASGFSTSTSSGTTTGTSTNTNAFSSYSVTNLVWLGDLMQLSVDENGSLRDINGNCIGFSYDPVNFVTNVNWFALGSNGVCTTSSPSAVTSLLSFTGYNWNAGPQLLTTPAASRTIFTSIGGTTTQFTTANDATLCQYMNVDAYSTCSSTHSNTDNLINWVRGSSVVGYRDRTYDVANDQYKLGDILHSTPTVVGAPQEDYNLLYQDAGYSTYFTSNETRQRVVYAGANDGMLHAFDAGTYTGGTPTFSNGTGNELWAYIPYNLLPHLQWLADPSYGLGGSHIEYVDSKMKITDVNFGTSASPNWKTVLIGGMRLGGGKINKGNVSTDNSLTFRSAYFALDITVPTAPVVLWEVNASNWAVTSAVPDDLGFTMSYPAVAKVGDCFYAVVGSGPKDSYVPDYAGNSNQMGTVFIININACAAAGAAAGSATEFISTDPYGYFSDPIAVDITLNPNKPVVGGTGTSYGTDAIYIGETYSTIYPTPNPNGAALGSRMWRLVTNNDVNPSNWKFGMIYTDPAGAPISAAPAASSDPSGNLWLFWGTGRLLSPADQADVQTQAFYGIKDPCWLTTTRAWDNTCLTASTIAPSVTLAQLVNVTGSVVSTTGTLTGVAGSSTFTSLITAIEGKAGWYFNLTSLLPSNPPTERAITKPTILGGLVLFNSFIPNNSDPCALSGSSYTYAVYYLTGTASPIPAIGTYGSGGSTIVLSRTQTAVTGMASNIAIHSGQEKGETAFIQMSTGEVITVSTIPPITAKSGIISWREM